MKAHISANMQKAGVLGVPCVPPFVYAPSSGTPAISSGVPSCSGLGTGSLEHHGTPMQKDGVPLLSCTGTVEHREHREHRQKLCLSRSKAGGNHA